MARFVLVHGGFSGAWDLIATDGPSKGGWPCSGGVRPAGDGQHVDLETNTAINEESI